ncbi:MAG: CrcB protein [Candidatus Azotimanducaceae bacterium]|jgi:CrcB protein
MLEILAIALGGALGAVARYLMGQSVNLWFGTEFPYGILIINIVGSLFMGVLFVILVEKSLFPPIWRSVVLVGFLGAFTTFSTFSLQTLSLIETGRLIAAATYVLASVFLCLIAVSIGIFATRELTS